MRETDMDQLAQLTEKFQNAFHDRLVSVVLYGSGASETNHDSLSDVNILCVLKEVSPRELAEGEPVVRWWRELGHPAPLLLSEEETTHSADSFPIEFQDMKDRRKVLFGVDLIADLHIDKRNYRTQVEHELRSKLIRLRTQAAHVLSNHAALLDLCLQSVSTFCVLGRHALAVSGVQVAAERRLVVHKLGAAIHADMSPFLRFIDIRESKQPAQAASLPERELRELFAMYLSCVGKMIEFVDGLG